MLDGYSRTAAGPAHSRSLRHGWLWAVLGCVVLLPGCESAPAGEKYGVGSSQFKDVVVPAGFRLRDSANESYSREEADWRQGHFVYHGSAGPEEAISYVRERMPQHSWKMVGDPSNDDNGVHLRFERGVYSADYTFLRAEGSTRMVVDYTTDYSRR